MKNMTKKSSFFNTFSAGLILSCLGTNVFKCEASNLREEAREEVGNGKPAAASSSSSSENAQTMLRRELIEPEDEENLKLFWKNFNDTYRTLMLAAYNYQENIPFDSEVVENSKKALPEMTSALTDLRKAHRLLLLNKKQNVKIISQLKIDNQMQKAKISELEEQLQLPANIPPVVAIPHNPEKDVRITELEQKVREQATRLVELESLKSKNDTIVIMPDLTEKDHLIASLEAEKNQLLAEIDRLKKQSSGGASRETKRRWYYWFFNPWTWIKWGTPVIEQEKTKV